MVNRILRKGMDIVYITDSTSTTSPLFADQFQIWDDKANNSITLSLDLNYTYKGSKQAHTYMDIARLDEDWSVVNLIEVNNNQVLDGLLSYLKHRSDKPERFYVNLIAKNQTTRQVTFEKGSGLRMRVID